MMTNLRIHSETEMMDRNKMEREREKRKETNQTLLLVIIIKHIFLWLNR